MFHSQQNNRKYCKLCIEKKSSGSINNKKNKNDKKESADEHTMETMQLIEQKVDEWKQDILFFEKLKKKVNVERNWGQEVARTIDEEISFLQWKISDLSQIFSSQASLTENHYQPAQSPAHDILSANIEQEIRERFLGHKKEISEGAQSLV